MKVLAATLMAATLTVAYAQAPGRGEWRQPPLDQLKAYLGLNETQVQALEQISRQQQEALQEARAQLRQKEGAAPGRAEMEALRKRVEAIRASFQPQAVNVLTAEQKAKLKGLEEAAKLAREIREAYTANLLSPEESEWPGPMRMGPGSGPGFEGRRGGFGRPAPR